jgi:hypothetical protein
MGGYTILQLAIFLLLHGHLRQQQKKIENDHCMLLMVKREKLGDALLLDGTKGNHRVLSNSLFHLL